MEELLKDIGINNTFTRKGNQLIYDIKNGDEYGRIYSLLDKSDLVDEDEESSMITMDNSSIQWVADEGTITLIADFNLDEYKLVVREE